MVLAMTRRYFEPLFALVVVLLSAESARAEEAIPAVTPTVKITYDEHVRPIFRDQIKEP